MDNPTAVEETLPMINRQKENEILCQIAALLTREALLNPEEYLRFLALLGEEN